MKLNRRQIQRLILREMAEMGMGGDVPGSNVNNLRVADKTLSIALVKAYFSGYEACESGGGKTADGGVYPEGIIEPLIAIFEDMGYKDPFDSVDDELHNLADEFLRDRGYN